MQPDAYEVAQVITNTHTHRQKPENSPQTRVEKFFNIW